MNIYKKVGIVTVTYNSKSVLTDFLSSCFSQENIDFILYCVDNNSTDNSLSIIESRNNSNIKIIKNPINYGFAKASNQGVKLALEDNCNYILLINNDTVFDANMISILLNDLQQHNGDFISPKIIDFNDKTTLWAGGDFKFSRAYANTIIGYKKSDAGQYTNIYQTFHTPFCCVLFDKKCFEINGLLDERYFVYWEDSDWCFLAKRNKLCLLFTPNTVIQHKESSLTGQYSEFKIRQLAKGRGLFLKKYFHPALFLIFIPIAVTTPIKLFLQKHISLKFTYLYITNFLSSILKR